MMNHTERMLHRFYRSPLAVRLNAGGYGYAERWRVATDHIIRKGNAKIRGARGK